MNTQPTAKGKDIINDAELGYLFQSICSGLPHKAWTEPSKGL
jgi:hypothetical protein